MGWRYQARKKTYDGEVVYELVEAYPDLMEQGDTIIPVIITVYADRSFSFITKTPPAAVLLMKAAKLKKGSSNPKLERIGKISRGKIKEIAELKMPDLNAFDVDGAMKIIEGTARSMGLTIVE